ncbi:hypothetical protein LCGC14_2215900, partial [marine sediment metagenome]
MLTGLYAIHLELTSRCNKSCWMCGRRKIDKDYPEIKMNYGDMDIDLVYKIIYQIPKGIIIHFHSNGEPLLYNELFSVLSWSYKQIRHFDTNGKLLLERINDIIDNCECITISTFPNDSEADKQFEDVKKFLEIKGDRKPRVMVRFTGDVQNRERWDDLDVINRILHAPMGSYNYEKRIVKPEIGICLEVLNHLAIDRFGNVSNCVRFDYKKELVIGNLNKQTLDEIWNSKERKEMVKKHINGERNTLPLCKECDYWGIPRG